MEIQSQKHFLRFLQKVAIVSSEFVQYFGCSCREISSSLLCGVIKRQRKLNSHEVGSVAMNDSAES